MSDMALGDWPRKAAVLSRATVVTDAGTVALRFAINRPLTVAGLLIVCLAAIVLSVLPLPQPASPAVVVAHAAPAITPVPPPAWLEIIKPIELFSLEAADLAKAAKVYRARRHLGGGGRQDVLALGTLGGGEPAIRLSLYRRGQEDYVRPPVFADVAKLAAEAGLSVARAGLPDLMPTRFGRFEVADVGLRTDAAPNTAAACSGFRLVLAAPALTMTGLACGSPKAPMSRARLGCLLDRLDLASGGEDRQMVNFFAASELKRNGACDGMRLAPDLVHAAWLDDRPATPPKKLRRH